MCLIIGDTPSTLLLSWKLNLSKCFIILVSDFLTSDTRITWKVGKSCSHTYKPNIIVRDLDNLFDFYTSNKIDIIIVSSQSISQFTSQLKSVEKFIHDNIVIVINSDFAVELELFSLSIYPTITAISVLVDVEIREISKGSYLVATDPRSVKFGITYNCDTRDKVLKKNVKRFECSLKQKQSSLKSMMDHLEKMNLGSIVAIPPKKNSFGLLVWEGLIPKISLNLLSIVFGKVSYDEILESSSSKRVFQQLVRELTEICYKQTNGGTINDFAVRNDNVNPEYFLLLQRLKNRQNELERAIGSEQPGHLNLNYEAYCFYYKIEFPCALMLEQCIGIAEKYGCENSSLTFLSSLYSNLVSLTDMQIRNHMKLDCNTQDEDSHIEASKMTKRRTSKVKLKSKIQASERKLIMTTKWDIKSSEMLLPQDVQELYLGCNSMSFTSPLDPKVVDIQLDTTTDYLQERSYSEECSDESVSFEPHNNLSQRSMVKLASNPNLQENDNIDSSLTLPLFKGFKNTTHRPMTTGRLEMTDLEWQLRHSNAELPRQMLLATKQELKDNGAIRHQSLAGQYWKLIKQQHINNGQLTRPMTSQEDILRFHCETLTKAQVHLSTTSNRYGDLDFSGTVFENWKQRRGALYRLLSDR